LSVFSKKVTRLPRPMQQLVYAQHGH